MVLVLSTLLLTLATTFVNAQNSQPNATYVNGLVQALNNAGLTSLATAIGAINSTAIGSQVLGQLSNTTNNYTVFAPDNGAFGSVSGAIPQDPNALADIVAYHVVFGHFTNVTDYPNTTIGRTALGDPNVVMLEGNKNQVVAWARRGDGQVHVLNQDQSDPRVVQLTSYENLDIYVIDGILFYPGNLDSTFDANNKLSGFASFARSTQVTYWDTGSNSSQQASVDQVLSGVRGLTLFAPDNQALGQLSQLSGNTTQIWDVLRNHIINGTTVYSPSFSDSTFISAAGQNLQLSSNSSGKFVTSGNSTARIVQPDVLIENGVIHIIDQVLVNTNVNQDAANSAYSSATSAAGRSSTETGPVGVPTSDPSNKSTNGAVENLKSISGFGIVVLSTVLGSSLLFA